ncbi:MAG: alcohol dehydrogenase catalytic domain-containing protein [candidate division NC10 bacterium]|nr:alcohol dehydrogenase catalytic domain-containing protein [candidate division NC10 bacterium]
MKAAVFLSPHYIELKEVDRPKTGPGEVLVRVKAAGICGTDARIFKGSKKIPAPRIIGHEFSGEIEEVGVGVEGWKRGDRVTVEPIIACGRCYCCLRGRFNICLSRPTIGYEYDGAFAQFVRIPAEAVLRGNLIRLPEEVNFEEAAFAEPLAACIQGNERARIRKGDRVWILGDGPIGLTHVQLAALSGAGTIILSGTDPQKLKIGKDLGAHHIIQVPQQDAAAEVNALTEKEGVDVAITATSVSQVVEDCLRQGLRKGGLLLIFAGVPPDSLTRIDPNRIHYQEFTITGSSGHSVETMRQSIALIRSGSFRVQPLISHRLSLEQVVEGIHMKDRQEGLKHLIFVD